MKYETMIKKYLCKMGYGPMIAYDENPETIFNPDARLISVERRKVSVVYGFEDGSRYVITDATLMRQPVCMNMDKKEVFDVIVEYLTK